MLTQQRAPSSSASRSCPIHLSSAFSRSPAFSATGLLHAPTSAISSPLSRQASAYSAMTRSSAVYSTGNTAADSPIPRSSCAHCPAVSCGSTCEMPSLMFRSPFLILYQKTIYRNHTGAPSPYAPGYHART